MSEKQFEAQVKQLAKMFGWLYYHTWRSIHSPAGFPDCVMVRGDRLLFIELKSSKGKVSPKQQEWLDALMEVNRSRIRQGTMPAYEVYLWVEGKDKLEEIAEILR